MGNCPALYEFAQQSTGLGSPTAREDDILPYIGWVVIRLAKLQFVEMLSQTDMHNKKIAPLTKMAPTTFEELLSCNKILEKPPFSL